MFFKQRFELIFILISGILSACTATKQSQPAEFIPSSASNNIRINSVFTPDSAIQEHIAPYAAELDKKMNRVLTRSTGTFTKDKPESTLGNLVADILRRRASLELGRWVDMSITNSGGLRTTIGEGPVKVGDIYRLMPFENTLVVLTMTGNQIEQLAAEIAEIGGAPVSGLRMSVRNNKPNDILLGSRTLVSDSLYLVATNNYLANGGENFDSLTRPVKRNNTGLLIRTVIIEALEKVPAIDPQLDYRLRK